MQIPSNEQLEALRTWRDAHPHNWKQELREAWFDGDYGIFMYTDTAALLQQIRNTFGPSWLNRLSLPKAAKVWAVYTDPKAAEEATEALDGIRRS